MENIYEQLRANAYSMLSSVLKEIINSVTQAMKDAAMAALSDLQAGSVESANKQIFPVDELQRNLPVPEYTEQEHRRKSVFITLLEVYAKYKSELFNHDINEHHVWNKIANEMHEKCNLNCDELQCRNRIEELRREYERVKNRPSIHRHVVEFLNAAEKAFGTSLRMSETLGIASTSAKTECKQRKRSRKRKAKQGTEMSLQKQKMSLVALQAYRIYKEQTSLPNANKKEVRAKFFKMIRKRCSLNESEYGVSQFCSEIRSLRREYKRIKKSGVTSPDEDIFLQEARLAFHAPELPGTLITYDRDFLMQMRNSPIARNPPKNLPNIPRITSLNQNPKENRTILEEKQGIASTSAKTECKQRKRSRKRKAKQGTEMRLQKQKMSLVALQAYRMYKEQTSLPNANKKEVRAKIFKMIRKRCSLNESEYGVSQFCSEIRSLRREYKRIKKSGVTSPDEDIFLQEARLAFHAPELPGKFNHEIQI